jgi:hypothetical protein
VRGAVPRVSGVGKHPRSEGGEGRYCASFAPGVRANWRAARRKARQRVGGAAQQAGGVPVRKEWGRTGGRTREERRGA